VIVPPVIRYCTKESITDKSDATLAQKVGSGHNSERYDICGGIRVCQSEYGSAATCGTKEAIKVGKDLEYKTLKVE
jgi:hypothetical protein